MRQLILITDIPDGSLVTPGLLSYEIGHFMNTMITDIPDGSLVTPGLGAFSFGAKFSEANLSHDFYCFWGQ